ncbi:MAG TPA: glutamyl-tRNA reductase [Ignavibacteriaceae bacterium]|nr:glutamyl-tRNA reductase [Ignavibacteriaceae bacterium]
MNLLALSINHNSAPVELREALFLQKEEIDEFINKVKGNLLTEGLIISTCNRTEIYGLPAGQEIGFDNILNFLLNQKPVPQIRNEHFKNYFSRDAVKHLFRVITGIDSMLIGDNQIYHQVKDSFLISEKNHFSGFLMKRLFDAAIKTGKRAISETDISEGAVTVSYAAVQLVEKIFSSLNKKAALVIGAGETGEIAAKHLKEKGIGKLSITNRTLEKAEKIAGNLNAKILPFGNFKEFLHEHDIVISATKSEGFILSKDDIHAMMKKRNFSPTVLMDIAVPRDIDPAAKEIDYVFYNDIDSLSIIVEQNLAKRKDEIPRVERIIEEEVSAFFNWYNSLEIAPTIKHLRDIFETIRSEEISKNKNRFNPEDQEKIEIITRRIINKILHNPTVELKKLTETGTNSDETAMKISIIRELFGMEPKSETGEEKEDNI